MTRTNAGLAWVVAILASAFVAVPAAAADGYESISAITGPGESSAQLPGEYESLSAISGPTETQSSPTGHSSLTAIVGADDQSAPVDRPHEFSSLASLVGPDETPTPSVEVREASGFDWGDALVGALAALALMAMAAGTVRLVGQQRRTVESSACALTQP
jgi:hypothetical protein